MSEGIVLCGFSKPGSATPNRRIVEIGVRYASRFGTPIYAQLDTFVPDSLGLDVTYSDTEDEYKTDPTTTLRMARRAVTWAQERGLTHLSLVGAKPHIWRCIRDQIMAVKEAGADIEVDCPFTEVYTSSYPSWFYPSSTQWWCRSMWHWIPRELILYLMPFWLYKRVVR